MAESCVLVRDINKHSIIRVEADRKADLGRSMEVIAARSSGKVRSKIRLHMSSDSIVVLVGEGSYLPVRSRWSSPVSRKESLTRLDEPYGWQPNYKITHDT